MAKAVSYARYSPRPNSDECLSIERQQERIREWCEREGLDIRGEFSDSAVSGSEYDRDGVHAAVQALRRGDVFVVYSLDRLARDQLVYHGLKHQITSEKRARLVSVTEQHIDDSPSGELLAGIIASYAAFQRRQIAARTRAKMRDHQSHSRAMGGKPPYGWCKQGKQLVPVPAEQEIRSAILDKRRDGWGYQRIATWLNRNGRPARGAKWHAESIRRMIERPIIRAVRDDSAIRAPDATCANS